MTDNQILMFRILNSGNHEIDSLCDLWKLSLVLSTNIYWWWLYSSLCGHFLLKLYKEISMEKRQIRISYIESCGNQFLYFRSMHIYFNIHISIHDFNFITEKKTVSLNISNGNWLCVYMVSPNWQGASI